MSDLYNPPLRKTKGEEFFAADRINNDLAEFTFDYLFSGKRRGRIIDLFVLTWIIDADDHLFIRKYEYNGYHEKWKEVITEQIKSLLVDLDVGPAFIKSSLRFLEIDNSHHREMNVFEKEFLELKAKIKP